MSVIPLFLLSLTLRGIRTEGSNHTNQTEHDEEHYALAGIRTFTPELEIETRIIGGKEAWAHSWPWQVSLRYATMPACGGAIIAPSWVITAAHCFQRFKTASSWMVMAGKHDLGNPNEAFQQLVGVSRIVTHQGYSRRTKEFDVALLKLQTPLLYDEHVRPIEIWMDALRPAMSCSVTGWGSTRENGPRVNRLQEVNVSLLPLDKCNQFYRGRIWPTMFCAGRPEGGVDACQGDSGGPLSCFTGERYRLGGLVSWGVGCGRLHRPGVYTKLQDHAPWVADVMNSDRVMIYSDSPSVGKSGGLSCGEAQTPACRLGSIPATLVAAGGEALADGGGEVGPGGVTEACPYSWPWQVSLQSEGRHYCSGTLIHRHWVLAPHHCNAKTGDMVVLGVHDLRFMASQSVPVDEVFEQAQDGSFPPSNDLALIRLSEPARSGIPVCLPDDDIEVDDSWTCVTTGWGQTKTSDKVSPHSLHQATVSLVNLTASRSIWGEGLIKDTHLCTHPAAAIPCMGDAGAPLVCQKHGVYFLFGLVTWGSRRCDLIRPAVFSSIADVQLWIRDTTEDV
ncbi:ovochymase-1 isoform X3 [Gadus chalcogrammus]|uniref:ovochymase-1 isoform X3 n=1 Tax=Gadus chalcogrammus TaxID=1042646 RepID=UPI0024C34D0A|nr:ovochymase-1 isoform X3 [Gadus chalcogrammus]